MKHSTLCLVIEVDLSMALHNIPCSTNLRQSTSLDLSQTTSCISFFKTLSLSCFGGGVGNFLVRMKTTGIMMTNWQYRGQGGVISEGTWNAASGQFVIII